MRVPSYAGSKSNDTSRHVPPTYSIRGPLYHVAIDCNNLQFSGEKRSLIVVLISEG